MKRREMLLRTGAAALGLSALPLRWAVAEPEKRQKVLYFTRSAGFVHSVVNRQGKPLAYSEKILVELGAKNDIDVVCSQDGAIFDGDLNQFDAIIFYTSGNLTGKTEQPQPGKPMSVEGKKRLLSAIAAGKGFVGIHAAADTFRQPGTAVDPFIAMLGGEFLTHESQQKATMRSVDPKFPGMNNLGDGFAMLEEWYAFWKFASDTHVLLVQETAAMHDATYRRPPYPATWARMHQKGRVFYTSMGHREDVWTNPTFQQVLLGGIRWVQRNVGDDVTPNILQVTPAANKLKR
ncbi:MAG: ThuA domain-containing protein [Thermoguttaceae bacterium]